MTLTESTLASTLLQGGNCLPLRCLYLQFVVLQTGVQIFQCSPNEVVRGPVVFINIYSDHYCDAVVLCQDASLLHIPLPDLSQKRADRLRSIWTHNLARCNTRVRRALGSPFVTERGVTGMLRHVLSRLWTWVMEPILRDLSLVSIFYDSLSKRRIYSHILA